MNMLILLNSILALAAALSLSAPLALAVDPDEELALQQERRGRRADDPSRWPAPPVAAKTPRKSPIRVNDPMDGRRLGGPKPPSKAASLATISNDCLPEIRKAKEALSKAWNVRPNDLNPSRYEAILAREQARAEAGLKAVAAAREQVTDADRALWKSARDNPSDEGLRTQAKRRIDELFGAPSMTFVVCGSEGNHRMGKDCEGESKLYLYGGISVGGTMAQVDEVFGSLAELKSLVRKRVREQAFFEFMKPARETPVREYRDLGDADEFFRDVLVKKLGLHAACFPEWETHRAARGALDAATTAMDWVRFEMGSPRGAVSKETAERAKRAADEAIDASGEEARRAAEREWTSAGMANP